MSAFLYYEGTADYLAATPALIVTFAASGSITAGRGVVNGGASNPGYVYQPPSGTISGSLVPAGVALSTVSDGDPLPVLVWGYAKSLTTLATASNNYFGQALVITGSGYWGASGSTKVATVAGKIISGSAGYIYAFINCMDNVVA